MVFTGTNTLVNNSKSVTSGDNFKFVGTMTSQKLEDIYALDGDGKIFNHFDGETDIAPFQAYFAGSPLAANGSRLIIRSVDNKTTAIGQLPAEIATPDAIYTLDGRKARHLPVPAYKGYGGGDVYVSIWVNPMGRVVAAKVNESMSTPDSQLWGYALDAAKRSRFSADESAPAKQEGEIVYRFIKQY